MRCFDFESVMFKLCLSWIIASTVDCIVHFLVYDSYMNNIFCPFFCKQENPKYERFKNKDMGEICDRYSRLFRDTFDSSKYVFTLTNLLRRRFGMQNDSDSDQVTDCLPLPLESSSSSDELDIDRPNASKARSSKRSGSKHKSTSRWEKGRKNMGHVRSRLQ